MRHTSDCHAGFATQTDNSADLHLSGRCRVHPCYADQKMTAQRTYRAGLGIPPAVTITSDPIPTSIGPPHLLPDSDTGSAVYQPKPRYPQGYTSYAQWKEWHINPSHHGPEHSRGPPIFLPSAAQYDELGRSVNDGVDVLVDSGEAAGDSENKEDGQAVAEWYTALSRTGSGLGTGRGGDAGGIEVLQDDEDNQAGPSRSRRISPEIIDLTGDDDDEALVHSGPNPRGDNLEPSVQPVRVHQKEWFIRRALANTASTAHSRRNDPKPSSIGSLLNIAPTQNRAIEAVYVLGPENKGHQILRERLGWGGGGLGRPEGWQASGTGVGRDDSGAAVGRLASPAQEPVVSDSGSGVVILDDTSDEDEGDETPPEGEDTQDWADIHQDLPPTGTHESGPGRTAPIATALKLDRLGLGYRLQRPVPRTAKAKAKAKAREEAASGKDEAGEKRVTHTHAQILEAQRRARYTLAGAQRSGAAGAAVELGRKGKIKWKEHDKRERDERRRMISTFNE